MNRILLIEDEYYDNPYDHTTNDVIEHVNPDLMSALVRTVVGTLDTLLQPR